MKVIVLGCGRVGSQVSLLLAADGHDVTVIDHNEKSAEERLGNNFKGRLIHGLGFDKNILEDAGIKTVEAFVAASSSDNANIVSARIARQIFNVPRVIARLYDPRRAEIYQRLGLTTISTTTWGAHRIHHLVSHTDLDVIHEFGRGEVTLVDVEVPSQIVGRVVKDLTIPGDSYVITITREDKAFIPTGGTEMREGDILHMIISSGAMERVEQMLGLEGRG